MTDYDKIIEAMAKAAFTEDNDEWNKLSDYNKKHKLHDMRDAFQAILDSGFVVVPMEATSRMIDHGQFNYVQSRRFNHGVDSRGCKEIYKAMLEAGKIGSD